MIVAEYRKSELLKSYAQLIMERENVENQQNSCLKYWYNRIVLDTADSSKDGMLP